MRIDRTLEPLRAVASLFYPALCAICHAPVPRGDYICQDCLDKAQRIVAPFCARCSEPFPGAIDGMFTCANCAIEHWDLMRPCPLIAAAGSFVSSFCNSNTIASYS